MAVAVLGLNEIMPRTGNLRLIADVAAGAVSYMATLMLLWVWVGRPEGPERDFWYLVRNTVTVRLRRYLAKLS
jgi:hypothetical protein